MIKMISTKTKKTGNDYKKLRELQKENNNLALDNLNYFRKNYMKKAPLDKKSLEISEKDYSKLSLSEMYKLARNLSKENLELAKNNYALFKSMFVKEKVGTKKDLESEVLEASEIVLDNVKTPEKLDIEEKITKDKKSFFSKIKNSYNGIVKNAGNVVYDMFNSYLETCGIMGTDMLDKEYPGTKKIETVVEKEIKEDKSEFDYSHNPKLGKNLKAETEIKNYKFLENKPVPKGSELILYNSEKEKPLEKSKESYFSGFKNKLKNVGETIKNAVGNPIYAYINACGNMGTLMLDKEYPGTIKIENEYKSKLVEVTKNIDNKIKEPKLEGKVELIPEETFEGSNSLKTKAVFLGKPNYKFLKNEPVSKGSELILYESEKERPLEKQKEKYFSGFKKKIKNGFKIIKTMKKKFSFGNFYNPIKSFFENLKNNLENSFEDYL